MNAKSVAELLGKTGLCVCPDFLSPRALMMVAKDFERVQEEGLLKLANVGRGPIQKQERPIRTDHTYWLDRGLQNYAQKQIWRKLNLLMAAINRELFLGLSDFEGHYASYCEGGYYKRHRDCLRGDSGRIVSFVLYLNRNWRAQDGGELRLFATDAAGVETATDINPIGGTMVCFLSAESEHEVLLNHKPRHSLTGWFKRAK